MHDQKVEDFLQYVKEINHYNEAVSTMYWDLRTGAPKKGVDQRSEVIGTLSTVAFQMATSDKMKGYLNDLLQEDRFATLDRRTQRMVEVAKEEYDRSKKIPQDRYQAFVVLTSKAESVWEEAHHADDFPAFQPYLEKIVEMNQEFLQYWGYETNPYNTLLDQYEKGMTVEQVDPIFKSLREATIHLLQRIQNEGTEPRYDFLHREYPIAQQEELSRYLLQEIGYDFVAGRLDESLHPFTITLNSHDVRITTKYIPNDLFSAIGSTVHEGGHALYEQNIAEELLGTNLAGGTSMGVHESQSRFWENIIGRSQMFWKTYFPHVQSLFPVQLGDVNAEEIYRALNRVQPSLIRVDADELTYNLHIMVRYELEKDLINGELKVKDLPELWRAKMKEYLGVEPTTDREGVLQDVHWSGGSFGYFPTYTIGNIYSAQLAHRLEEELGSLDQLIADQRLTEIRQWLTEHIHRHGKMLPPAELIRQATGEAINSQYLIHYLTKKYQDVYQFN
ncbi:carboxypeptidase M32 [Rubeoparvulum massiliense]|uniref:carboxypeptidase M32 n=1 Tax=Rubeoparvulum massiliense TaxID=1631346 RepID=UPI00065E4C05|nr:carboxypeptidase M32 [Rubeoparvulum massiliense]